MNVQHKTKVTKSRHPKGRETFEDKLKVCKSHAEGYQKSNHGHFVFLKDPRRKNTKISKFRAAEKKNLWIAC